jgi:tryptophan synthase beta chain
MRTYVLQDEQGQVKETHSISAGLDYPAVGPEHAYLHDTARARYLAVDDGGALEGFQCLARTEGILPALESSHALGALPRLAKELGEGASVIVCLSGRGDKDLATVEQALTRSASSSGSEG